MRRLGDRARVVRLYAECGPQTTSCGCFRLSTAVAVEDIGGSTEDFEQHLDHVCAELSWSYDPVTRVLWITDWFEFNPPANPNVVESWVKLLNNVPDSPVRTEAILSISDSLKDLPVSYREPFAELSRSFRKAELRPNHHPNHHPETNQGSGDQGEEEQARFARWLINENQKATRCPTNG
jgi:hypothetical protein